MFTRNEYEDYLQSDEWRKKAQQRLLIDNHKCQMCGRGSDETVLSVHHINYRTFQHENPLTDLITLCPVCHERVHVMMCRITGYRSDGTPIRGWRTQLPYYIRESLQRRGLMA